MDHKPRGLARWGDRFTCPECRSVWVLAAEAPGAYWQPLTTHEREQALADELCKRPLGSIEYTQRVPPEKCMITSDPPKVDPEIFKSRDTVITNPVGPIAALGPIYEGAAAHECTLKLDHIPVRPGTFTMYAERIFGMPIPAAGAIVDDGNGNIVARQANGNSEIVGRIDYLEGVVKMNFAYIYQTTTRE